MADKFRNCSIYFKNGRKIEFMTDGTLDCESNSEQIIVDGKVAGASEGVETSSATVDSATCVAGKDSTQSMFDAYKAKEYNPVTFGIVDGRILSASMMVKSLKVTTKASTGVTTMSFSLVGGSVDKVG